MIPTRTHRVSLLILLTLLFAVAVVSLAQAGLRDIIPRPQQMGILSPNPMPLIGAPYLVVPANLSAAEQLVRDYAIETITNRIQRTPIVVAWGSYAGQVPAIWMGTADRFPALRAALDSTALAGLGVVTYAEEYQLYVEENRILLMASDLRGLRWGIQSLSFLIGDMNGQAFADRVFIRDWPDYSKRVTTINSPIRIQSQADYCNMVADLSFAMRATEIEWNDGDAAHGNRSAWSARQAVLLRNRIRDRGQMVTMSCDAATSRQVDPSWQEGIPIRDTRMRVGSSGFTPIANSTGITILNAGFETWTGNRPSSWFFYHDNRWPFLFRDTSVKHSGGSSAKFTGFNLNPPPDVVLVQPVVFPAERLLKIKFWFKTSGFDGRVKMQIMGPEPVNGGIEWTVPFFPLPTQDWTLCERIVASAYGGEFRIFIGAISGTGGTLWIDDLSVETADLQRMLRRSDTPLSVYRLPQGTVMTEGIDYRVVETDTVTYNQYVRLPRLERLAGGALNVGDSVRVSWSHGYLYQQMRETPCYSKLEPLLEYQSRVRTLDSLLQPDGFKISINEVSYAKYDTLCTSSGLTPGQLVGRYCNWLYQIIQARRPGAFVRIYSDPFDIFCHDPRLMPITTLPWTAGSLQQLSPAIEMMALTSYSLNYDSTLTYFQQNGRMSVLSMPLWEPCDNFLNALVRAKHYPSVLGVLTYWWDGDCNEDIEWKLSAMMSPAWNFGPFIVHTPPRHTPGADSIRIFAEIWSDTLGSTTTPYITSASLTYRLLPNGSWTTVPLSNVSTDRYAATIRALPPGTPGMEYYLSATDHRQQLSRSPGDAPTRVYSAMFMGLGGMQQNPMRTPVVYAVKDYEGFTVIEWETAPGISHYEVHRGLPADFNTPSATLIACQPPTSPRFLIMDERRGNQDLSAWQVYAVPDSGTTSTLAKRNRKTTTHASE